MRLRRINPARIGRLAASSSTCCAEVHGRRSVWILSCTLHAAAAAGTANVTHNNRSTCWKYEIVRTGYCRSYYSAEMMDTDRLHVSNNGAIIKRRYGTSRTKVGCVLRFTRQSKRACRELSATQHNTRQYKTIQCNTVQYNTIKTTCSTLRTIRTWAHYRVINWMLVDS